MAFNKNKALEGALKYLNQGKVAQAITEYQQILRHEPKDQATLMTVGDLYARQGDMSHAVEYFERLAQVYLSDGFNSKAIAIYKKIGKLAPNELAPLERLADLYVQQGVLSEARPLFLQIAEVHLKANRSQKAVEVLQRLLDIEPDNPRIQMRLAELYNAMGQKKEAAHTYLSYGQRLLDHGETDEALRLVDRALELEPGNASALLLKGKSLASLKKTDDAIKALSAHPDADAGGELTDLIFSLQMESCNLANSVDRARKQLARGHAHFGPLLRIADAHIDKGQTEHALELLRELREPMIEAGEQDKFLKSLTAIAERSPNDAEPLEMLIDFCRHTSDPFRLSGALGQLSDLYAGRGEYGRAVELLEELADRNKEDERIKEKLAHMRARAGDATARAESRPAESSSAPTPAASEQSPPPAHEQSFSELPARAPERDFAAEEDESGESSPAAIAAEDLDEETQRYVAQALTDADLFSSYGLTQKATVLLENVLQRAPRHTPSLERLLDLYLGAGNERRTAEIAALLEQIHQQRGDTANADRFAETRKRFQKAAGMAETELPVAPPAPIPEPAPAPESHASAAPVVQSAPPAQAAAPAEFEIPLSAPEPEPQQGAAPAPAAPQEFSIEPAASTADASHASAASEEPANASSAGADEGELVEELDLSDEWEAMSQEGQQAPSTEPEPVAEAEEPVAPQAKAQEPEPAATAAPEEFDVAAGEEIELIEESPEVAPSKPEPVSPPPAAAAPVNGGEPRKAAQPVPEPPPSSRPAPEPPPSKQPPVTTDDFIRELVAEIEHSGPEAPAEGVEAAFEPATPPEPEPEPEPAEAAQEIALDVPTATKPAVHAKAAEPAHVAKASNGGALDELAGIFQEFRDELGEMENEEEDLETHYNLGIAYREMGLLDEAVSEFQRVAKAVQKGKPFPYAMNCATLLALSFMDKQQPNIAAYWYQRALETPGIDQEAELALRYDLGVAQETAGQAKSALSSFQQVYAMNIDYRDVADRIASLQKHAPV